MIAVGRSSTEFVQQIAGLDDSKTGTPLEVTDLSQGIVVRQFRRAHGYFPLYLTSVEHISERVVLNVQRKIDAG